MSKSYISLAAQTAWYSDEPFAVWLRLMALNIKQNVHGALGWISEIADDWLRTSELLGISNAMGVDLNDDFPTYEMACALREAVNNINEILNGLQDSTLDQLVRSSGMQASCSITDLQAIGKDVNVLLQHRLDHLQLEEIWGANSRAI